MNEGNLIIKASAGTGKTFSLATRFIRLMLFGGARPERIIALTFSRAAAQEIYTKILERLWKAAEGPPEEEACEEREFLLDGFDLPAGLQVDFTRRNFARLLRALINTQHLGAIATLDSFILRIVSNFPQELGFQNAVEVLDGIGEKDAVDAAIDGLLTDGAAADAVAAAFGTIAGGTYPRTCLNVLGDLLNKQGWRAFVLSHLACANWTVESMAAALGVDVAARCPDLGCFDGVAKSDPSAALCKHVRAYDGEGNFFPSEKPKALMLWMHDHPEATSFTWTTSGGKETTYEYSEVQADAIRAAAKFLVDVYLKRQLEMVVAKIRLVLCVETEYHDRTRRQGKLTFQDFTDYSAAQEGSAGEIALQNLEFRFDSKFEHWALDEFQDTSEVQWRCLGRLVRSAADGEGGRTVLAVGDQKQSIYTWRGASRKPFDELLAWEEFQAPRGKVTSIDLSHRYGRHTADFVNAVFGPSNDWIDCPDWREAWPRHAARGANDYVKVIAAVPDADPESDDEILPTLCHEVAKVWQEHRRTGSGESVGILVRGNETGMLIADYLRAHQLPVVWEGLNIVHDLPVVQGVLDLLRLGDHPEDTAAWKTVSSLYPRIGALLPACDTAEKVSAEMRRRLSQSGLARTLKDFSNALCEARPGLDNLSRERLSSLVGLAVDYEQRPGAEGGSDGFIRFIERSAQRELAVSTDVIRILTIHRSKGLTLDRVFVPLFECKGDKASRDGRAGAAIDRPKMSAPMSVDGEDWVLPHLSKGVEAFNAKTKAAYGKMCRERLLENLRTYYVALTRARRATYVVFPQDTAQDRAKGLLMRDLVAHACADFPAYDLVEGGQTYGRVLFEAGAVPEMTARQMSARAVFEWTLGPREAMVKRVSPSGCVVRFGGDARSAAALLAPDFGRAAAQGTEAHAAFAAMTWATAEQLEQLPEAFRPAFARSSENAAVWRERSYEIYREGRWETGQFDRVVFSGSGAERSAVIYDFKTNARKEAESLEAFHARLARQYRGQMDLYAAALATLTGLPRAQIKTCLLLTATGSAVPI